MNTILKTYTGNAMLNNALMTIEALCKAESLTDIKPSTLLELYKKHKLPNLYLRMKSYTMLFTLNNPLVNPQKKEKNIGEKTYDRLMLSIMSNFENEGVNICAMSGLRFNKTFSDFYKDEIEEQKAESKKSIPELKEYKKYIYKLDNTDLSINRTWVPLAGGLGSDAQALPQAKYAISIHPICIVILQFLPLSSLLYKGGILLIDSSNFQFTKQYIKDNTKLVLDRISSTRTKEKIENIKDYTKGNYLLKAIELLLEMKEYHDSYSDVNLWNFSNSGTGASCEIDRVPNPLIKKLLCLYKKTNIRNELKSILGNNKSSGTFLEALEGNLDWYLLYPNVFKKTEYEGVSVEFLEAYYNKIKNDDYIEYAKYLAHLIDKYKSDSFAKYLNKRDAYNNNSYHIDLFAVLIKATEDGKWSLLHHLNILDSPNELPIKNYFYKILKITHFFYYKKCFSKQIPDAKTVDHDVFKVSKWMISLIQKDDKKERITNDLLKEKDDNYAINYLNLFYRNSKDSDIQLDDIFLSLYNDYNSQRYGLNAILRLFFSQENQEYYSEYQSPNFPNRKLEKSTTDWFSRFNEFAEDYQKYYFDKYENKQTGEKPIKKFLNQIEHISNENSKFYCWLNEAIENVNKYLKEDFKKDKWSDDLLYNPNGERVISTSRFILKFTLLKQYRETHLEN